MIYTVRRLHDESAPLELFASLDAAKLWCRVSGWGAVIEVDGEKVAIYDPSTGFTDYSKRHEARQGLRAEIAKGLR